MSYILDALRKADAERETGAVPDLHAQQYITMPADDEGPRRTGWLIALAGLLGAALIGVLAWALLWRNAPRTNDTSTVAAAPTVPTPSTGTPGAPLVVAAAPAVTATATPPAPSTAVRKPAAPSTKPEPTADEAMTHTGASKKAAAPPLAKTDRAPVDVAVPSAGNTTNRTAADGGARSADRIYTMAELPEAVRKDLPTINVNGSSYSSDASSRLLIVNGQVLHEGDPVAGEVRLEKIRQRSAVLSVKGYRYEIMY